MFAVVGFICESGNNSEFWQGSCASCTDIWDALASRTCVCDVVHETNPAVGLILHLRTAALRFGEDVQ